MDIQKWFFTLGVINYIMLFVGCMVWVTVKAIGKSRDGKRMRDRYFTLQERYYELYAEMEKLKRFVRYEPSENEENE